MTEATALSVAVDMAGEFDVLSQFVSKGAGVPETLDHLVHLAVDVLDPCHHASVTKVRQGTQGQTLAYSDDGALVVDRIQYDVEDGPCWQIAVEDEPDVVWSHNLEAETRWPAFVSRSVRESDVRTIVAFGLAPGLDRTALNIYGLEPDSMTSQDVAAASLFAVHAQVVVRQLAAEARASHLAQALSSNRTIGSAVGMIMWIHKVDEGQAFDVLRRSSQNLNVKVRDLAEAIVTTGDVPSP